MSAKPIYSSFRGSFASYVETLARLSISIWESSLVNAFPGIIADEV